MKQQPWYETYDDRLWLKPDVGGEEEAAFIKQALQLHKGQRVLDAPCGAGRIAVPLAKMGCCVTGIDIRKKFINRARARCKKEGMQATFKVMNLLDLDFTEEFHGVCSWFGSFGYFSDEDNLRLLAQFVKALRKGGRLLVDQINREWILRNFKAEETIKEEAQAFRRWDKEQQRIVATVTVIAGKHRTKNFLSLRLYTPAQLAKLFKYIGLKVEAFYASQIGGEFNRSSPRMIIVGRKV
ncbi:MAG: methyltransferase domain-containing protein [Planctomycetes bacterium]|nr:methyltransferase domain-containing protein [Planctomycetota bacterium]